MSFRSITGSELLLVDRKIKPVCRKCFCSCAVPRPSSSISTGPNQVDRRASANPGEFVKNRKFQISDLSLQIPECLVAQPLAHVLLQLLGDLVDRSVGLIRHIDSARQTTQHVLVCWGIFVVRQLNEITFLYNSYFEGFS